MPRHGEQQPRSMISGTTASALAAGTTRYVSISGGPHLAVIGSAETRVPFDCVISELRANSNGAAGAGESLAFTLMREGIATTLTCTIDGAVETEDQDLINQVYFNEDDLIAMRLVSSVAAAGRYLLWTLKYVPIGE